MATGLEPVVERIDRRHLRSIGLHDVTTVGDHGEQEAHPRIVRAAPPFKPDRRDADLPGVNAAIDARGLVCAFGTRRAVDAVDLEVPVGSLTGVVGPNGAGKTTLLRILSGLQRPDAGSASVLGRSVWPDPTAVRPLLGLLPDDLHLFERLSCRELLAYLGLLHRLPVVELERRTADLLEVLGLGAHADELVADLSTGSRKKVGLAAALLHAPAVVLLDEPFESVDPLSARDLRDVLDTYRAGGGTIVLSSHVMDTVQELCDRVVVLDHGRVVAAGPTDELRAGRRLEDVFLEAVGSDTVPDDGSGLDWFRPEGAERTPHLQAVPSP